MDLTTLSSVELTDLLVYVEAQLTIANYNKARNDKAATTQITNLTNQITAIQAQIANPVAPTS